MILSDSDIQGYMDQGLLQVFPLMDGAVQPASVDIRLDAWLRVFDNYAIPYIDPLKGDTKLTSPHLLQDTFALQPGQFVLGATLEHITLPNNLVARVEGKSSLGRVGLVIHATAGYVDPGWSGNLTLELGNISRIPIILTREMPIGQISFQQMTSPAKRPYGSPGLGSHYQGDTGASENRMGGEGS
jgi:dCTP deaminase